MRRNAFTVAAAGFCFCSIAALCAEPAAVISINRETIKEGRSAAHEKVETMWARAFRKANFPAHYIALTALTGAPEVWFINGYASFAAIEEADKMIDTGSVKTEMDGLDARDGELRTLTRNMNAVYRKDMSFRPDMVNFGKTRYWIVETVRVKLGHESDFIEGSKLFLAAYEKIHFPLSSIVYQVTGGAPSGTYLFLMPLESLKSVDSMAAVERGLPDAMGREIFGKMMKGEGDVFNSLETNYFKVNPRMSYASKEMEDADPAFWRPKPPAAKAAPSGTPKTN